MSEPCTCPPHAEPGDAWICPAHGHRYVLVPYYDRRYITDTSVPKPKPPPPPPAHGKPEWTPKRRWRRFLRRYKA